jgi:NAD(P)-dependent dehydrogenase (short-subunit alcohol dehydrogenase family)
MNANASTHTTAIVTGASRGFGRATAEALHARGVHVVAVARDQHRLAELGDGYTPVAADAADPSVAGRLLGRHRPRIVVLAAGETPLNRPLQHHTWETFSRTWDVDVRHAFHWIREALLLPLAPGSSVVAFSSGAALQGSPLSGGYAGAKATIRFISAYAAAESERLGLGIAFTAVLPKLTPATALGAEAVAAYAARAGLDVPAYLERLGPTVTAEQAGDAVAGLALKGDQDATAYTLTAAGLGALP